jgi:hypothetical protein
MGHQIVRPGDGRLSLRHRLSAKLFKADGNSFHCRAVSGRNRHRTNAPLQDRSLELGLLY